MWYVSVRERRIVIQNDRRNTYVSVTVPIATGLKENKSCHGGKKGDVAKIFSGEEVMK